MFDARESKAFLIPESGGEWWPRPNVSWVIASATGLKTPTIESKSSCHKLTGKNGVVMANQLFASHAFPQPLADGALPIEAGEACPTYCV